MITVISLNDPERQKILSEALNRKKMAATNLREMPIAAAELTRERFSPFEEGNSIDDVSKVKETPKSKYGNQKVIIDGHTFASKKEGQRYRELKLMEHAKIISGLEIQVAFHLVVNEIKLGKYVADFVYNRDDEKVIEDVKGWRDKSSPVYRLFKLKAKLVKAIYGIDVIEI